MSYLITDQCIDCSRCEPVCPTGAISKNEQHYQINPERCNDCVGHYAVPQCWAVCPTNGSCVPVMASLSEQSPTTHDYWSIWFDRYNRKVSKLKADKQPTNKQPDYWQRWFDIYAQTLSKQLHTHPAGAHS